MLTKKFLLFYFCTLSLCLSFVSRAEESGFSDEISKILQKYVAPSFPSKDQVKQVKKAKSKSQSRAPASIPKFQIMPTPTPGPEVAKEKKEEKEAEGSYSIFHPVPRDKMREFDSDRPGATDSPRTLDSGHVQLEMGVFNYTKSSSIESDGSRTEQKNYNYGSTALIVGLTQSVEAQLLFDGFTHNALSQGGGTTQSDGVGNTGFKLKWNWFGNEESAPLAMGIIPVIKFPSGRSNVSSQKVEGGVELPIALPLPNNWTLSLMPSWARRVQTDGSYYHEVGDAVILGRSFTEAFGGFVQLYQFSSDQPGEGTAASAGFGFTYKVTPSIQLDVSPNFGLTPSADAFNLQAGFVIRF